MKLKTEKSQIKINETKMWFFGGKKPSKIHNHPGRLAKKKKLMQITNIRKETGYITLDLVDFKRIIRKHYKNSLHI